MANIQNFRSEDTEIFEITVGASAQTDNRPGFCRVALQPNGDQFQGKLTITGGNSAYNGTFDVYGNSFNVPYRTASTAAEMKFTLRPGQNTRTMTGVVFIDDAGN